MEGILQGLIGLALLLFILWRFIDLVRAFIELITDTPVKRVAASVDLVRYKVLPSYIEKILDRHFTYYRNLPHIEKMRFVVRVKEFQDSKIFIGREDLEVTQEMKILIAASAVQITFGLKDYLISHFKVINIYPEHYHSSRTRKHHKGDVNIRGAISLSWKHFQEGYANLTDNLNLGIHEMAHALDVSDIGSGEYDYFFSRYYDRWAREAIEELNRMRKGEKSILRDYASTNIREFFAVSVEHFFESPEELQAHLPELYKQMCILLNQDPLDKLTNGLDARSRLLPKFDDGIELNRIKIETDASYSPLSVLLIPAAVCLFPLMDLSGNYTQGERIAAQTVLLGAASLFIPFSFFKIKKIAVYENGIDITYPFLPWVKFRLLFSNTVSISFNENTGSILFKHIDKHQHVREDTFALVTNKESAKAIIAEVEKENFLVKVVGYK